MVKGEPEAGAKIILVLTGTLIGCHCVSENDNKLGTWPEHVRIGLSPDWASEKPGCLAS